MAPRPAKRNTRKVGRQDLVPKNERTRPQGIKKERRRRQLPSRKSARLQHSKDVNTEPKHPLPSQTSITLGKEFPQVKGQKRRQSQQGPPHPTPGEPLRKRRRTSLAGLAVKDTCGQEATSGINDNKTNPIDYWREKGRWPEEYFRQDD